MKKLTLFLIAAVMLASCNKQSTVEEPKDPFNGYAKYLKSGPVIKDLKDKNNNKVGTVTYEITPQANFKATFQCDNGKELSKTQLYAGDKKDLPKNTPAQPPQNQFPNITNHCSGTTQYHYEIPLVNMPPADLPGFIASSHCNFKDNNGEEHDAWACGGHRTRDKGCGWFDDHYFDTPNHTYITLYAISYQNDSLHMYSIDVTNGTSKLIFREYVGANGIYDGAAYDDDSGILYFVNYSNGKLYWNDLETDCPSNVSGLLTGTVSSGTFFNGAYYYVNANLNTINKVTFVPCTKCFECQVECPKTISTVTVLDTIPSAIVVNDIAMDSTGTYMYISGSLTVNGTTTNQLLSWQVNTENYYTLSVPLNTEVQIAIGGDGILYAIPESNSGVVQSYAIDLTGNTPTLIPNDEEVIIIPDDVIISDISSGPVM
jgi:hypothetical protein